MLCKMMGKRFLIMQTGEYNLLQKSYNITPYLSRFIITIILQVEILLHV